jgi:hypothetical protein
MGEQEKLPRIQEAPGQEWSPVADSLQDDNRRDLLGGLEGYSLDTLSELLDA